MPAMRTTMKRTVYFDHLKLFSVLGVILIHVTAPCYGCDLDPRAMAITYVVNAIGRSAVPVFLMISGAILLGRDSVDLKRFYSKALVRYFLPTVAWALVYKLAAFAGHGRDAYDFLYILKNKNPGYHLWYMWMFLGVCLAYPFVHAMVSASPRPLLAAFLVVCGAFAFLVGPASVFLNENIAQVFNILFSEYLFYFVLGYFLERHFTPGRGLLPLLAVLYAGSVLAVGLWSYHAGQVAREFADYPSSPHSLLVGIQAACLFGIAKCLFNESRQTGPLTLLSSAFYGVFFVHVLFLRSLDLKACAAYGNPASLVSYYILTSLAVFAASFAVVVLLRRVPLVGRLFP